MGRSALRGLGIALLLAAVLPARPAASAPPEDLAAVLGALDLRLAHLEIDELTHDPHQRGTTVARIIVQDRSKVLTPVRCGEAAERLCRAVGRLGSRRLVACDVLFFDPSRPPTAGPDAVCGFLSVMMGAVVDGRHTLSAEQVVRLDRPVQWYARCVAYREYHSERPSDAPKSVGGTLSDFGPWRRADHWAPGNTVPVDPAVEHRVKPSKATFDAPVVVPDEATATPEVWVSTLRTERTDVLNTAMPSVTTGVYVVYTSASRALPAAECATRTIGLRTMLERSGLENLCWVRAEGVRIDRRGLRDLVLRSPMDPTTLVVRDARTGTYDRKAPESIIDLGVAVDWYAHVVEHRPMPFVVVAAPERGVRVLPVIRFTKPSPWRQVVWVADGNAVPVADPKDVPLSRPRLVK